MGTLARPVADRVAVWPLDRGRFGVDATFQGASGLPVAEADEAQLRERGARVSVRQELGGGWTVRLTVEADAVARIVAGFVDARATGPLS